MGLSGDRIGVLLGNGTGGFRSLTTFGSLGPPQGLALADLNADGKLDVVAAQDELSASLIVMLGNGTGGLGAPTALAASPGDAVAVADA
ncbi:MAG: VCBS repeat-containing protein [Polyangia bacterium]